MIPLKKVLKLREQIVLNSLYLSDYENDLGISADRVYSFFDGYVNYLDELAKEQGYTDDFLAYDNTENLTNWYYIGEL